MIIAKSTTSGVTIYLIHLPEVEARLVGKKPALQITTKQWTLMTKQW